MTTSLQSDLAALRETIEAHKWESMDFQNHRHLQGIYSRKADRLQEIHDLCREGNFKQAFRLADWVKTDIPKGLWEKMRTA